MRLVSDPAASKAGTVIGIVARGIPFTPLFGISALEWGARAA